MGSVVEVLEDAHILQLHLAVDFSLDRLIRPILLALAVAEFVPAAGKVLASHDQFTPQKPDSF